MLRHSPGPSRWPCRSTYTPPTLRGNGTTHSASCPMSQRQQANPSLEEIWPHLHDTVGAESLQHAKMLQLWQPDRQELSTADGWRQALQVVLLALGVRHGAAQRLCCHSIRMSVNSPIIADCACACCQWALAFLCLCQRCSCLKPGRTMKIKDIKMQNSVHRHTEPAIPGLKSSSVRQRSHEGRNKDSYLSASAGPPRGTGASCSVKPLSAA